jgi:hypothetical protein
LKNNRGEENLTAGTWSSARIRMSSPHYSAIVATLTNGKQFSISLNNPETAAALLAMLSTREE